MVIKNNVAGDVNSDSFECGDNLIDCTYRVDLNKTFNVQYHGVESLSPQVSSKFINQINGVASLLFDDYNQPRIKSGTFMCTINSGYRVEVILKPQFHIISGHLKTCCSTDSINCSKPSSSIPLKMIIPTKNALDGGITGRVICHVQPAADIGGMDKICTEEKLTSGQSFDAVGNALYKVMVNTAANGAKSIEHVNINGHQAWSLGMCWNHLSRDYCRVCLNHLVDHIWSECDNAENGQLWVNDCGLRYSTRPLNGSNYEDSFSGQHVNQP